MDSPPAKTAHNFRLDVALVAAAKQAAWARHLTLTAWVADAMTNQLAADLVIEGWPAARQTMGTSTGPAPMAS